MTNWNNLNYHSKLRDSLRSSIINIIFCVRKVEKECKSMEDELKALTPPMIQVKDTDVLRALLCVSYDSMLIDIIAWIEKEFGYVLLTEGYRGGTGVHSTNPCRGIDIRDRVYEDPAYVVAEINKHFGYDPDRSQKLCALWKDSGQGWHIHLQTHPNSYRKEIS